MAGLAVVGNPSKRRTKRRTNPAPARQPKQRRYKVKRNPAGVMDGPLGAVLGGAAGGVALSLAGRVAGPLGERYGWLGLAALGYALKGTGQFSAGMIGAAAAEGVRSVMPQLGLSGADDDDLGAMTDVEMERFLLPSSMDGARDDDDLDGEDDFDGIDGEYVVENLAGDDDGL